MVTPHSDDDGAKFSFFLDSLLVNKGFWSVIHLSWKVCIPAAQQNSSDSHKVLWMPAREGWKKLKENESFCLVNWWGLKNWIQAFAGCGEIAPEHITSTVVWHGGCHPALGPAQEQVQFSSDVVDSGGVRRLLNFFGRITHLLTQGVTHLEVSDVLWNLSAQALKPQQFPSWLRNPCCVLVWCKFHLSAKFMRAEFRV
jgi:hypothetical protein